MASAARTRVDSRSIAAYLAFLLSGASSLIFQTIWSRMLHHVFGASSIAISTVLTVFMAGLGLGAWLGGKYANRIKYPIIAYAVVEIGVGIWGLLVPLLRADRALLEELLGSLADARSQPDRDGKERAERALVLLVVDRLEDVWTVVGDQWRVDRRRVEQDEHKDRQLEETQPQELIEDDVPVVLGVAACIGLAHRAIHPGLTHS